MAASAIPGLDVEEQFDVKYPRSKIPPSGPAPGAAPGAAPMGPAQGIPEAGTAGSRLAGLRAAIPRPVATLARVAGKVAPLAMAADAASHQSDPDADARYAKRFGMDTPTYDGSVGDIARYAGTRTLGFASDLGNSMTMGLAGKLYADNQPGALSAPAAPAPAPNLRDAGAGRGFINPPNATAPQPAMGPITDPGINPAQGRSIVTRDGNSFSGKDISGDVAYKDAKTGQITVPTPRVSVIPGTGNISTTPGVTAAGLRSGDFGGTDAALSAARQAAADRGDWGAVANSYAPAGGGNTNPYPTAEELGLRGRRADRYTQQMMGRMSMDTQRAINERNVELGLRGQDMTYAGHMASNRLGIFNALREQGNADRQFGLQAQQQNFTERGEREKQLQGNLEKMFTTMDGDKPVVNQQAVQQARQGFDRSIARLGLSGPHQLSPMDEQRLMAGTSLLQKMRENAGWLPWQPDKLKTIDPVDLVGLRVLPNGDRQIARKGSNAFGQVIPRRFFTTEEGSRMGDWFGTGTPTNRYDLLSMGQ